MTDGDIIANHARQVVANMENRPVLYVGSIADKDRCHVAA